MRSEDFDAEQLALMLDGRLSQSERQRVLQALASNAEMAEVYGDAVAVAALVDSEPAGVTGSRSWYKWYGLAAAAVLVVAAGVFVSNSRRAVAPAPVALVAASESRLALPADWDTRPWPASRGSGTHQADEGLAARVGVTWTDYTVAVTTRDSRTNALAMQLQQLFEGVGSSAAIVALIRAVNAEPDSVQRRVLIDRSTEALMQLVPSPQFQKAMWFESVRLALASTSNEVPLARGTYVSADLWEQITRATAAADTSARRRVLVQLGDSLRALTR